MEKTRIESLVKDHQVITVIGALWGDEGKGKLVGAIAPECQRVARWGGGANAGHTLETADGRKLSCHLFPSGVAYGVPGCITRGVLVDLFLLDREEKKLVGILGKLPRVIIDPMASMNTTYAGLLESWCEQVRGSKAIGTTKKAIGPMAALAALRVGPVVGDLLGPKSRLEGILEILYETLRPILDALNASVGGILEIPTPRQEARNLIRLGQNFQSRIADTREELLGVYRNGGRVLLEGAQAVGLDPKFGTYPDVTSTCTVTAGAAMATGLPLTAFTQNVIVAKIFPTRVGNGPFVSELNSRAEEEEFPKKYPSLFEPGPERDQLLKKFVQRINHGDAIDQVLARWIQLLGDERGTTTGRGRSAGLPDLVQVKYAAQVTTATVLALTRLDMLSGLRSIPLVTGYRLSGKLLRAGTMPSSRLLARVKPSKEVWDCWPESIAGCTDWSGLPRLARDFVERYEGEVGLSTRFLGTGPGPNSYIVR